MPLSFSAEIDEWNALEGLELISIKTTLTNHMADTVKYVSMSCSWENAYTTDSRHFDVFGEACDRNFPTIAAIPPHGEEKRILRLLPKKDAVRTGTVKFRIGFNWITDEKFSFNALPELSHRLNKMENVLWSDTLELR
jgi:hypothetical protein